MNNQLKLDGLNYKIDIFKCATLDFRNIDNSKYLSLINSTVDDVSVDNKIKNFVKEFKNFGLKAIWIIIPIEKSSLIQYFSKNNFFFHHVEGGKDLFMYYWLKDDVPCNLPKYASHYLGVGGLIFDHDNKILLVKEKTTFKKLENLWKIPTGLAENGESIQTAILREIKEETGLIVKFEGIFSVREAYPYLFGTTDIFFICLCKCDQEQQINIEKGDELKECRWFSSDEIKEIIKDKKFSIFSTKLLQTVLSLIPDKINNYVWKHGKETKFLKSRFIFHSPKF